MSVLEKKASTSARLDVWVRIRPQPTNEDTPLQFTCTAAPEEAKAARTGKGAGANPRLGKGTTLTVDSTSSRSYRGLTAVLGPETLNAELYARALSPLVSRVLQGETACCFAYGHTGSGKTHSVVGYGSELGLYRHAVDALTEAIAARHSSLPALQLQVRCAELYQGKLYDLLSDRAECFLREDAEGQVHIRSSTQMDEQGRVRVQSLHAAYAKRSEDVTALVQRALASRAIGDSPIHSQSSRSHAFIELQLVTPDVVAAREAVLAAEAQLVPIGKARDGLYISIMSRCYRTDPERKGAYVQDLSAVPQEEHQKLEDLQRQVAQAEEVLNQARQKEQEAVRELALLQQERQPSSTASAPTSVSTPDSNSFTHSRECGTLVLVDLAGAEYASLDLKQSLPAVKAVKGKSSSGAASRSALSISEGKEINSSLLALKECMRALSRGDAHVPFRNSKLTLLLRRYLRAEASSAVCIATVAMTASQQKATNNTLQYAALLADT